MKAYRWLLNPKWLLFIPLLVVLVIGVACGGDEATSTPRATATPVPAAPAATATAVPAAPAATATAVPAAPAATATAVPAAPAATATAVPAAPAATATAVPAAPAATATPVPAAPAATATPVPVAEPTPTAEPVMAKLEPRYGEIIPMSAQSSPALIHPVTTSLAEGLYVSGPIYSQLVRYDPLVHRGAVIIGDVAKSWEVSEDGLVYTFRLHENVRFTDGEDLDADDVAFTINHILEPGAARPVTGKLRVYVDRAEKIDKYTVAIHLKFASSAFMKILAIDFMKIMPQHVIEAGVDLELFENMVGSGPFKGVSYTVGNNWEHEKNPDYFREGLPYFDGLHTFFIADEGTEIAAYRTERVLMNTDPLNNLDSEDGLRLEKDPDFSSKFDIWWMPPGVPVYLVMNTKAAPFDDERVRRAIILGFDRTLLTDGFGLGKFTVGMPMHPEYNQFALPREEVMQAPGWRQGPDGGNHPDDIAEAKRLLKEAGFDENNPLKAKFNVPTVIFLGDAGQVIQDQLKTDIGVELEFVVGEVSTIIVDMFTGNYQIGLLGEANIFFDPDDRFGFNYIEGRNLAQWEAPPRVLELYKQQQVEPDFEKRKQLNYEMQRLVIGGAPGLIDFSFIGYPTVVTKRLKTAIGHYSQSISIYQRIANHEHEWLEPE